MISYNTMERNKARKAMFSGIRRFVSIGFVLIVVVAVIASATLWASTFFDSQNSATYGNQIRATVGEYYENVTETEGMNPGPVEPLGYESEGAAAAQCSADQTVITLYRQRQIVGYGCAK